MTNKVTPALLKAAINESVKKSLAENKNVQRVMLEGRIVLINEMLDLNEADWLDRARHWVKNKYLGATDAAKDYYNKNVLVNPQHITSNPQQVQNLLNKQIAATRKSVTAFKADAIRSSQAINNLQDSVFDLFGKFFNLLDSLPQETRGQYEREVMQVVGMFYKALMEEKKRIEVYLSALAKETGTQGYNLGQEGEAMASYAPAAAPRVVGSRVVDAEDEPVASPGMAGARA
jgi:hypothetical protein